MRDHDLSELFGVFRGLGLEKREQPPVPRVPEKQALIWFDVKSCWAKPEWKKLAFLIGLTHSYPRGTSIHAAIWQAQVGPWFDAWIARAKAAPMTMLAERRSDGSGVVVWREPPTRASVFARLGEFNESEAKWRAVQPQGGAPQARPTPAQLVAGMTDPAKAWHALVSAGLVPPAWANEPRRRFQHADRWESFPRTVADCATIAEQLPAMARYEALAFDLFGRTAWWQMPPAPSVARWAVYGPMPPGSGPMVPPLLQGSGARRVGVGRRGLARRAHPRRVRHRAAPRGSRVRRDGRPVRRRARDRGDAVPSRRAGRGGHDVLGLRVEAVRAPAVSSGGSSSAR
ncbi:MAG TPA: hypothetical protein VF765_19625 [Polyangiaceae bacterium]